MNDQDIPLLLQWLSKNLNNGISKPSVSDTPGMGEMAPYQMPGLYGRFNNPQPTMPQGVQLPPEKRMLLERLLLDRQLQRSMDARKRANDIFDIQQQDRFNRPGMRWDHLPNFPYVGKFM